MGRWWIAVLLALGLMGGLILLARQIERHVPPYVAAVLPSEACHMNCWQGIQPGLTDYKTARNTISNLPNVTPLPAETQLAPPAVKPPIGRTPEPQDDRWRMVVDDDHQHSIALDPKTRDITLKPQGVRLGDIIAALGAPDFQVIAFMVEARELKGLRIVEFFYSRARLRVTVEVPQDQRLAPDTPVTALHYEGAAAARPFNAQDWRGFVRLLSSGFGLK